MRSCHFHSYIALASIFGIFYQACLSLAAPDSAAAEVKVGVIEGGTGIVSAVIISPAGTTRTRAGTKLQSCPTNCLPNWIGDGWCDTDCAIDACDKDGGDCQDWCAPDCKASWIGDGFCDVDCFRPECQYDNKDCDKLYKHDEITLPLPKHAKFDYSNCPSSCEPSLIHNGSCDDSCNIHTCNFDGGDCKHQCSSTCANVWLGDGECDPGCNTERCGFDKGDCEICSEGCQPGMIGNGICDPQCNMEGCHWDMGDCYGVCWSAPQIDYFTEPFFFPHCRTEWRGDGYCDCFCTNADCDFDFGDCKDYDCSADYALLEALNKKLNVSASDFPPKTSTSNVSQSRRRAYGH